MISLFQMMFPRHDFRLTPSLQAYWKRSLKNLERVGSLGVGIGGGGGRITGGVGRVGVLHGVGGGTGGGVGGQI